MTQKMKANNLIFEYFCSVRNHGMVDVLLKHGIGRKDGDRYVFHQIHQKIDNGSDEEDFYKGIEKEILEMMKKYEKDLDEETSTKAMNACIESRVQCVLCTLRGEKIDFQGFKSRIDKYFAEDLIPEYPGVDNFMAEVTYNKNRETLLKCLMKGESYVLKYAKSFFNDTFFIKSFKTRVIEALDMIESVVKGKPELLKIYESLGSDEETKSLASIANVIRKAHNSPVVAPQKEKKKVKKSAKKETKKKTPVKKRAPLEESTSSQITQDEEEEEEKVAEEKISEVPAQRRSHKKNKENAPRSSSKKKRKVIVLQEDAVIQDLQKARAKVAKDDPIIQAVAAGRMNKTGGVEMEWTQTEEASSVIQDDDEMEEDEDEDDEDDGRGKGPTPAKRGTEKFEAKKVKKKLSYNKNNKKRSFVEPKTTTTTTNKKRKKRVKWTKIEEEYLIAGVEKHGAEWRLILDEFQFDPHRTNVHLKDKWRNMLKKNSDLADKMK